MKKIAVLLVLYKDKEHLLNLLNSLDNQLDIEYSIFAIDCDEKQESIKLLRARCSTVYSYHFQGNLGYAAGNNFLARKAIALGFEYLFICNTDIILETFCLKSLLEELRSEKHVVMVGPLIYRGTPDNPLGFQSYGEEADFKYFTVREKYAAIRLLEDLPESLYVNILPGCAFLICADIFKECGLFNEEIYMYGDENDLAYRIYQRGYIGKVTRKAQVWHNHNWKSDNKFGYYFSYYYMNRNIVLLCKRYSNRKALIRLLWVEFLHLPLKIWWTTKIAGLKFTKYYYLGFYHGLLNKKGKVDFNFD